MKVNEACGARTPLPPSFMSSYEQKHSKEHCTADSKVEEWFKWA